MDLLLTNFQQIGNALGWALIHFIWQGFILVACYCAITRLLFKNKINLQYWTGILFIALSLIIPIKEFIIQLQLDQDLSSNLIYQLNANITLISSTGILNPMDMLISLIQRIIPYLVFVWTIIILLISSNLTKSWLDLIKLSKNCSFTVPNNLMRVLKKNSKILELKFKPIISISSKVIIPATFGFFKPVILLPASLISQLPQDQMEAILVHELCHIKRADFIHNILQLLVETLFFYHPFTKWMSADIRKIREQCCDQLVLKLDTKPILYANALTNLATIYNKQNKDKTSYLQIAATDGELLNRIKFFMLEKKTKSPVIHLISGLMATLLILTLFNQITNKEDLTIKSKENTLFQKKPAQIIQENYENKPDYIIPNFTNLINSEQQKNKKPEPMLQKQRVAETQAKNFRAEMKKNKSAINNLVTAQYKVTPQEKDNSINTQQTDQKNNVMDKTAELNRVTKLNLYQPAKNTFPKLKFKASPIYNRSLRKRGIEGTVILSFNINQKGRVKNIKVDKSSPLKLLDGSARQALRKWRFDSGTVTEQNIKNRYQQIFTFTLDNSNSCHNGELGSLISTNNICQDL